jgi:hypothetical protein
MALFRDTAIERSKYLRIRQLEIRLMQLRFCLVLRSQRVIVLSRGKLDRTVKLKIPRIQFNQQISSSVFGLCSQMHRSQSIWRLTRSFQLCRVKGTDVIDMAIPWSSIDMSISNPLHILAQHLLATSIVELGRAAVGVISHRAAGGGSRPWLSDLLGGASLRSGQGNDKER